MVHAGIKDFSLGGQHVTDLGARVNGSESSWEESSLPAGVRGHIFWGGRIDTQLLESLGVCGQSTNRLYLFFLENLRKTQIWARFKGGWVMVRSNCLEPRTYVSELLGTRLIWLPIDYSSLLRLKTKVIIVFFKAHVTLFLRYVSCESLHQSHLPYVLYIIF